MKRVALAALSAVFAVVLLPSLAVAKGPIEASVDGPGLASPLRFGGWSENAMAPGAPLMQFAEATGFFPAVFKREPDPMLARRPKGDLGPRYVVDYRVPGPNGEEWQIVQDLYPYAKPNPVTYMSPGQRIYEMHARGGWFVAASPAAPSLMFILTEAGLPKNPPAGADGSPFPWTLVGALAALGGLLALGRIAVAVLRHRPCPAV